MQSAKSSGALQVTSWRISGPKGAAAARKSIRARFALAWRSWGFASRCHESRHFTDSRNAASTLKSEGRPADRAPTDVGELNSPLVERHTHVGDLNTASRRLLSVRDASRLVTRLAHSLHPNDPEQKGREPCHTKLEALQNHLQTS